MRHATPNVVRSLALSVAITLSSSVSSANAQLRPRLAFAGKLTPCRVDGLDEEVLCGRREVFENREAATGRRVTLNIVVLPATTENVVDDPLVFLAGGGVVPATRYARFLGTSMRALRRQRDILLVDQRGTGASGALTCDRATLDTAMGQPPDVRYLAYVAACRASLAMRADVRFYTTSLAMDDLDDVRAWLGYPALNLYGASYGTSAAATYIRRHPSRVRSVVMHGVVPFDFSFAGARGGRRYHCPLTSAPRSGRRCRRCCSPASWIRSRRRGTPITCGRGSRTARRYGFRTEVTQTRTRVSPG